ncbi:hypothetical protein [Ktedonobacter racemifer]|uniref:Uncharacterized protein n=1 Tax=Ktedonobacter racemifer DSM 44963 TaxID=485913 RepID=D6U8R6_KTERA|nr:hypothetical protein [Ktedonobacter racemifer]EFH79626.1 hypothetical protein Krac_0104 [Ktedonobacter racemifer DSM 44963]
MNSKQIVQYLEELSQALSQLGAPSIHILVPGGAFMLLQGKRQLTLDIDFVLIENPNPLRIPTQGTFQIAVQRTEVSKTPYGKKFKRAIEFVASQHKGLAEDWMNDEAAVYYYDDAPFAEVRFWRNFNNVLYVYLPSFAYMFAAKVAAYRQKDIKDIQVLKQELNIQTRAEAQAILDKFLLPDAQEFWEVDKKLKRLFRK